MKELHIVDVFHKIPVSQKVFCLLCLGSTRPHSAVPSGTKVPLGCSTQAESNLLVLIPGVEGGQLVQTGPLLPVFPHPGYEANT